MFRTPASTSSPADSVPAIVSFQDVQQGAANVRPSAKEAPCELTAEFMNKFEQVSGWQVEFKETLDSQRRHQDGDEHHTRQGRFEIVDMSASWPAKTPTMHRGECDELISMFSDLVAQRNSAQADHQRVQSTLTALTTGFDDDEHLVDTFLPTYSTDGSAEDFDEQDWVLDQHNPGAGDDSEFVVRQGVDSAWLDSDVWEDWAVAGATGISGDRYLDWTHCKDKLTVYVGRLESSFGTQDAESQLDICAASRRFRLTDETEFSTFYTWDRRGSQLQAVVSNQWQTLPPGAAIVVSTTQSVSMPGTVANLNPEGVSAENLVAAIEKQIDASERLFVIKYQ